MLIFAVFTLLPVLIALYLSFTNYDGLSPATWAGLANYRALLHDPALLTSIRNTLIWVAGTTLLPVGLGLLVAVLSYNLRGGAWMRLPFLLDADRRRMAATGAARVSLDELMRTGAQGQSNRIGYLWLELARPGQYLTVEIPARPRMPRSMATMAPTRSATSRRHARLATRTTRSARDRFTSLISSSLGSARPVTSPAAAVRPGWNPGRPPSPISAAPSSNPVARIPPPAIGRSPACRCRSTGAISRKRCRASRAN